MRAGGDARLSAENCALKTGIWIAAMAAACPCAYAGCRTGNVQALHVLAATAPPGPVHTAGVVTAVFPGLGGFFLEAPQADWDSDPATPEAIFVYSGRRLPLLQAGDEVALAAELRLFHGVRELTRVRITAHCGIVVLPPPLTVDLPLPASRRWRSLIGMRVRFPQPLAVSNLRDFGHYGEIGLSAGGRRLAPTAVTAPGPGAIALAQRSLSLSLWLDDGSTAVLPWPIELAGKRFDVAHPLRMGQEFRELEGIAFHVFRRDLVEATEFRLDRSVDPRPAPSGPELPAGLRVASLNVENYFNHALRGAPFPTERGARTPQEFACQTSKLATLLAALRPALVGLEEIENDGYGPDGALAALTAALDKAAPDARYRYVDPGSARFGSDLIAPALVYDATRLEPTGRAAVLRPASDQALLEGLKRPALAASFRVRAGDLRFTVVVVHLRAKYDSCGRALDGYQGSGYCAGARDAAAAALAHWLADDPTGAGTSVRLLLGDFNAYPHERAIRILKAAGWQDVVSRYVPAPAQRYTTAYRTGAGALDYVFANRAAAQRVTGAAVWHVDADEAPAFDYSGHPDCSGQDAVYRASDHDPVIVVLNPGTTPTTGG